MTALVVENSMLESHNLVKKLVADYFKVQGADVIEQQLNNYQKMMEQKRQNAYNYFLKSKTNPELKQKMDENRRQWYEKHKDRVQEKFRERRKNDPEFREKLNAQKREYYQKKTADIPKQKRGRKPKNNDLETASNSNDSNDNSNETKSSDGECKELQNKPEQANQFKGLSKDEISVLIEVLQKQLHQSQ